MARVFHIDKTSSVAYRDLSATFEEWVNRYSLPKEFKGNCEDCGEGLHFNVPVFFKGWRGLQIEDCKCGADNPFVYYVPYKGYF